MRVEDCLRLYIDKHAPTTADPERIEYAAAPVISYLGGLDVEGLTRYQCQQYAQRRAPRKSSTIRRELSNLRAALQWCADHGYVRGALPVLWMPAGSTPRERWLTRKEARALLDECPAHVARFVEIGLRTGTRKSAILALRYEPNDHGGHVDLEAGLLHRRSATAVETKKRQVACKIPPGLLRSLERWQLDGQETVVHYQGGPVSSIRRALKSAADRAGLVDVVPHTLKHTAITWAMQDGVPLSEAAGFFGTTIQELERTYVHHHPDYQRDVTAALDRPIE